MNFYKQTCRSYDERLPVSVLIFEECFTNNLSLGGRFKRQNQIRPPRIRILVVSRENQFQNQINQVVNFQAISSTQTPFTTNSSSLDTVANFLIKIVFAQAERETKTPHRNRDRLSSTLFHVQFVFAFHKHFLSHFSQLQSVAHARFATTHEPETCVNLRLRFCYARARHLTNNKQNID